ncbi:MAG TPA: PEGA domain-containing protein [Thermomicrobiales bacterium]|nr:PEGA domain-containing protein [Thermomicrobiales bacterium]
MRFPIASTFALAAVGRLPGVLRRPRGWALAALLVALVAGGGAFAHGRRAPRATTVSVPLTVTSTPRGAAILVDGRARGRTPAGLTAAPGTHRVTFRLAGYADADYAVRAVPGQPGTLAGILWPATPRVRRIRPPLPGATVVGADFLADGRLALRVALPPGDERELWVVDRTGAMRRVGPPEAHAALALSPDGREVAYLARPAQPPGTGPAGLDAPVSEVWVTARDGTWGERRYALPPGTAGEGLTDLSWAPDGRHLLLVSQQHPQSGGVHTRLLWLDVAGGIACELASLPSDVAPDSYAWRPDGAEVAFLANGAGRVALCVVGTDGGPFRYLADVRVGGADSSDSLAFPPLAWSPDGRRVADAAPPADAGNTLASWFGAEPTPALAVDDLSGAPSRPVGGATGWGPGWRADDRLVVLARGKHNGPPLLRLVAPDSTTQDGRPLPLPAAPIAGVRWDLVHGAALVALGSQDANGTELWLVDWSAPAGGGR